MLGPLCDQEGKRYSFNEHLKKYASLNNSHKNRTNTIFYKNTDRSIDRLVFVSYGGHAKNFCASLGISMRQGRRIDAEVHVTKSRKTSPM